ncbi:hypothetical protein I4U23_023141 [Adineta vaga]|nr:hypothetical protein I4U23_023141 [Adineta vaga]
MFHPMTISVFFVTLIIISHVYSIEDSCGAGFNLYSGCSGTITTSRDCKTSKLNLGNTTITTCNPVGLFWSYPTDNLTLTIETLFTKEHRAYKIVIDNKQLSGAISHVYRIINGKETEVTTTDEKLFQTSDTNYQVILKLQGPPTIYYYGVFIDYQVIEI